MANWTKEPQPFGANHAPLLTGLSSVDGITPVPVSVDPATGDIGVSATFSATSLAINDGSSSAIKATVLDLTGSNPLTVAITDGSGNQITSFGGGTQYITGTAEATPTGTLSLGWDGTTVKALPLDGSGFLKVNVAAGGASGGTSSSFGSAFPATGTAVGATDGTNMQSLKVDGSKNLFTSTAANVGLALTNWTWTTATTLNTVQNIINNTFGYSTFILQVNPNGSVAGGKITIEGSIDGTNFNPLNVQQINGETGLYPFNGVELGMPASIPIIFQVAIGAVNYVQVRLSTVISGGGGSVKFYANLSTTTNFGATSELGVSIIAPQSGQAVNVNSAGAMYNSVILSGTSAALADTTNFGAGLTQGIAAVGGRVFNPGASDYDRQIGDETNGMWVNVKAISAGSSVIGHVITDTGSTTAVTGTVTVSGTVTANAGTNLNTSALALESGGNLATLAGTVTSSVVQTNEKQINGVVPLMGNGVTGTGSQRVTIASDNTAFSVNATLSAETTKVIGTVNQGTSPWVVAGGGTAGSAASGVVTIQGIASMTKLLVTPDVNSAINVAQINGVTPLMGNGVTGTGSQRVTIASDNTAFSVNATLSAETTKVIGVTRTADGSGNLLTSTGNALDINIKSGNLTTLAVTNAGTFAVQNTAATPAGTNAIGSVNLAPTLGGWSAYALGNGTNAALTTTQAVSAAPGKLGGYITLLNLNSAPAYIQVFDLTTTVTLGTTRPNLIITLPANSTAANGVGANLEMANGVAIANGIQIAATTTSSGASTVATGIVGTILFK